MKDTLKFVGLLIALKVIITTVLYFWAMSVLGMEAADARCLAIVTGVCVCLGLVMGRSGAYS